ncbi:MAG TPA: hypothetical protein VHA74_00190 [Candidatus Dojkabacteria bacterium]|nr:hypothetical protein [Candidatus Dojkabacteria bacterium]
MNNEDKNKKQKKKIAANLVSGKAINLLPPLTETEKIIENTKSSLNINAALAIMVLVIFSIAVVGINFFFKVNLNNQKNILYTKEQNLNLRTDIIASNNEILKRVKLYKDIAGTTISSKTVVDYWNEISKNFATIDDIEISRGLVFDVSGRSSSLDNASKLWYILANDPRIQTVNLKTIVKDASGVRFTFEGDLNFDEFIKLQQNATTTGS